MGATDPKDATYYKRVSELSDKRHHSLTMLMRLIAILAYTLLKVDLDLRVYLQTPPSSTSRILDEAHSC